jgi:HAMP domain-containing protein
MASPETTTVPDMGRFTLRFTLVAAFAGVTLLVSVIIGIATSSLVSGFVRDEFRLRLGDLASVAASQIDVVAHHRLREPQDQSSPGYSVLRDHLRELRDRGTHIRFVYTTRLQPDGQVVFVVDAEEKPEAASQLGDLYADASPELKAAFAAPRGSKALVTRRFYTDAWGTWMSAYVPLYLPDGRVDAVLGLDMSADHILEQERRYQYVLWGTCLLLTLLLMPLAYGIAQRIRRPLSRLETDMSQVGQFNLESTPPIRSRVIEINRMVEQLERMRSGLRSFQKYVPAELVRRLIARGVDAEPGGIQQELTVFMSDIEGFTSMSERMEPDALVHHLSEYLTEVSDCLLQTGATVDQYIGDAVLAFQCSRTVDLLGQFARDAFDAGQVVDAGARPRRARRRSAAAAAPACGPTPGMSSSRLPPVRTLARLARMPVMAKRCASSRICATSISAAESWPR